MMGDGPIPEAWITREYVEELRADLDEARDNERKLARYVHEAAGPESCLIPIASLTAISAEANRLRTEVREAMGVVRQFAPSMAKQEPTDIAACIRAIWDMGSDALAQVRRERDEARESDAESLALYRRNRDRLEAEGRRLREALKIVYTAVERKEPLPFGVVLTLESVVRAALESTQ